IGHQRRTATRRSPPLPSPRPTRWRPGAARWSSKGPATTDSRPPNRPPLRSNDQGTSLAASHGIRGGREPCRESPRPACGERSPPKAAGEGDSQRAQLLDGPPHPLAALATSPRLRGHVGPPARSPPFPPPHLPAHTPHPPP